MERRSRLRLAATLATAFAPLAATVVLVAACGDDGGSTADGDGSNSPLGGCLLEGQDCKVVCDDGLGCVECGADTDCGAAKPACAHGRCRGCGENADCATGQACFPKDGECKPACTGDEGCKGDEPLCDLDGGGRCVGCIANDDCPAAKPVCDPVRGRCGECSTSADCGAAEPACDAYEGECRQCNVDSDCREGAVCKGDHKCHDFCDDDLDCDGDRKLCRTDDGDCVGCLLDLDCGAAAPYCNERDHCVECQTDANCPAERPGCNAEKGCVVCATDAHCKDPLFPFCNGDECVECNKKDDCEGGLKCKGHRCED